MRLIIQEAPLEDAHVPTVTWTLTGVALLLSVGRYAVRWISLKRFHLDDLTHLIALVALVGYAASVDQYVQLAIKELKAETYGIYPPAWALMESRKWQLAYFVLAWISLWFVKLTCLLFYLLLFQVSARFQKVWWVVMIFTVITFWAPIAGVITMCGPADHIFEPWSCNSYKDLTITTLIYSSVLQIVTDLLIMALPLWMIHKLQMRFVQKLGLGTIFSIALVTIALEIVRTVKTVEILQTEGNSTSTPQFAQATLYLSMEVGLNAWISSIFLYKTLFEHSSRVRKQIRKTRRKTIRCRNCGSRADEAAWSAQSLTLCDSSPSVPKSAHTRDAHKGHIHRHSHTHATGSGNPV